MTERKNSFEFFGINHLSPSSLDLWASAPGLWAHRYIGKVSDKGGARMWQGTAVGNGLAALLRDKDIGYAIEQAHRSYDLNCAGEISDEIEAERLLIDPMLRQCLHWQAPGPLNATELKVEYWLPGIPIPIIGYLDLGFDGIDVEVKCTKAIPSVPRWNNVKQASLYRAARGRAGGLLYISAKRHAYYDVSDGDMNLALEDLRAAALSLSNFLARMETKEDILKSLPVDWSDFRAPKMRVSLADVLLAG